MKSRVHFAGKIRRLASLGVVIVLFFALTARAETYDITGLESPESSVGTEPPSAKNWLLFSAAEVATILLVSQTQSGPLIFGGIYAAGTLFYMREILDEKQAESLNLIVPAGMLTMSVLNFALLNNTSRFSYGSVFTYNLIGAGALTAYAWWDSAQRNGRHRSYSFVPVIDESQTGLAWMLRF